ncbi:hypothetical protein [Klenkia marina]|nr:hypothetical protein [Klenkia marina]
MSIELLRGNRGIQSAILSVGWPVLYLITVLQTLFMIKELVRRQRGFTV